MDYNQEKEMFEGFTASGAIGVVLIIWNPGNRNNDQYIPIFKGPFEDKAKQEFLSALKKRNEGVGKDKELDARYFIPSKRSTSKFGLDVITFEKHTAMSV